MSTPISTDLVALALEQTATSRRKRDERGMTTAEYAVGTVAAASFAGVLIKILTDEQIQDLLLRLIMAILNFFMKVPGL